MARMVSDDKPFPEVRTQNIRRDNDCHVKAVARGQMTFTVVEQDLTAPETILEWIKLNWKTAPVAKLRDAFETALAMQYSDIPKKTAD